LRVPSSASLSVYFSPDGSMFATGETDGTAIIWNTADGSKRADLSGHSTNILVACFNPAGDRVLTCGYDKTARVWDLQGKQLAVLSLDEDIHVADWSPDGNQIVVNTIQGSVRVFDSVPWRELVKFGDAETSIEDRLKAWSGQLPVN